METPNRKRETRGCIDLGSSYFRLLVGRVDERGSVEVLCDDREHVGWGTSVARGSMIGREAEERALRALGRLLLEAERAGCSAPFLVGTNTLRAAVNRGDLLAALGAEAGRQITVLSQRGEAALGFRGACTILEPSERALLFDIGGTSTEIAWGRGGEMEGFAGLALGTHSVASMMQRRGRLPDWRLFGPVARRLEGMLRLHYALPDTAQRHTILATGGTAVSLAVIAQRMADLASDLFERVTIPAALFDLVLRRVIGLFRSGFERRVPVEADRMRLLIPGLALMRSLIRALGAEEISVTARDLRWGALAAGADLIREYALSGEGTDEQESIDCR